MNIPTSAMLLVLLGFPCISGFGQGMATGTVRCRVLLERDLPALPQVIVDKTIEVCGTTVVDPLLIGNDRRVQNAVVSLDLKNTLPMESNHQSRAISLVSEHCLFKPRVQAVQVGAYVRVGSNDKTTHNPHCWWEDRKTVFNLTLLDPALKFKRKLRWPGIYRIDCDTHKWMKAYILVFEHPFFSVTDEEGSAVLVEVPPGKHTLRVWHEVLGEKTTEILVESGETVEREVVFLLDDQRDPKFKHPTVAPWPDTDEQR